VTLRLLIWRRRKLDTAPFPRRGEGQGGKRERCAVMLLIRVSVWTGKVPRDELPSLMRKKEVNALPRRWKKEPRKTSQSEMLLPKKRNLFSHAGSKERGDACRELQYAELGQARRGRARNKELD